MNQLKMTIYEGTDTPMQPSEREPTTTAQDATALDATAQVTTALDSTAHFAI